MHIVLGTVRIVDLVDRIGKEIRVRTVQRLTGSGMASVSWSNFGNSQRYKGKCWMT